MMKKLISKFMPAVLAAAAGLLSPSVRVQAQTEDGTKVLSAPHSFKRADFEVWAQPRGKYSIRKSTLSYKEYDAYAHWGARFSDDGDMNVEPFMCGQADYGVRCQIDGHDVFDPQKYIWSSTPATYVPIIPPPPPDENSTILLGRQAIDWASQFGPLTGVLPGMGLSPNVSPLLVNAPSLVTVPLKFLNPTLKDFVPEWWEDWVWQHQLSVNAANPPDEWKINTSTANKRLTWNFGLALHPPPTQVEIKVSDSQTSPQRVVSGKVKINWSRPPQQIFDITVLPVEWQVPPDQRFGNYGNYVYTMFSSDKLQAEVGSWAGVQIIAIASGEALGVGVEAASPYIIRVVTSERVQSTVLARAFGDLLERIGPEVGAADAEVVAASKGKLEVAATEITEGGAAVETGIDTRGVGANVTPAEAAPVTRCEGGRTCFVAGTLVVMGDGSLKPIEQVRVGDLVWSRDPLTKRAEPKRVTRTFVRKSTKIVDLHLKDGQVIQTTPDHPIFTEDAKNPLAVDAVPAGELGIGSSIITRAGPGLRLENIEQATFLASEAKTVYNFSVEGFQTYFVGASAARAIWVHNAGVEYPAPQDPVPGTGETPPLDEGDPAGTSRQEDIAKTTAEATAKTPPVELAPSENSFFERARPKAEKIFKSVVDFDNIDSSHGWSNDYGYSERTFGLGEPAPNVVLPEGVEPPPCDPTISGISLQAEGYTLDGQAGNFANAPRYCDDLQLKSGRTLRELGETQRGRGAPYHAEPKMLNQWAPWLLRHSNLDMWFNLYVRNDYICQNCREVLEAFVNSFPNQNITIEVVYGKTARRGAIRFQTRMSPVEIP